MSADASLPSRPGARVARRPLHFIFLLDGSGSMATDGKIQALNAAISAALPHIQEVAVQSPFAEILLRSIVFADGARWHVAQPTPVAEASWPPVVAGGYTDLGAALNLLSEVLTVPPMDARAYTPILVLVSDGRPTDDYRAGLSRLMALPWGRRAIRVGIAIGADADRDVLQEFIADPTRYPFEANDPEQLAYLIRFVSTAASQMSTSAVDTSAAAFPEPQLPVASPQSRLVW